MFEYVWPFARNYAEILPFHKISTPGKRWNYVILRNETSQLLKPYNGEVAPANLHIYFHNFSFSLWNKQSFLAREKNIKFNMFRFCLCDHFIYLVSVLNSRYVWSEKCALKKKDLADWISINSIMQIHLYCITTSHAEIYSHEPNRI